MKFLCVHGACTNPETMKWSLSRLLKQLSDDETITIHFAQGYLDSQPPQWLAETLEGPPYLRFFQWPSVLDIGYGTLEKSMWAVDIPEKEDDKLAPLFTEYMQNHPDAWSIVVALEYLHNIIEDEGPFHGVIGVSEGASVAATLLAEDNQSCKARQTRSDFRCGLFYIDAPAWSADGMRVLSGDEDGHVIDLPTCHIMGATDVFKVGAEQLLKICDRDTVLVINDPDGRRIPQDMPTNQQIADWIRAQERVFVKGEA